jgi:glycosyltransferase involved in cell wall biosynthesis
MAEESADPATRAGLAAAERAALSHAALVIVTSPATARTLTADYAVPPERLVTALPGVDAAPLSPGSSGRPVRLLALGAVIPRKDPAGLVRALADLAHLDWHLTLVGDTTRATDTVAEVRALIAQHRLEARVTLTGELSQAALDEAWACADVFVSASRHEGYGMAVAEALAHGLPVVTTEAGAVAGWIDRRAALVVPVADPAALRDALAAVLADPVRRATLRAGAAAARASLPRWPAQAALVDASLQHLTARSA